MSQGKTRPTVEELYETIKRTNLPTVLVEGKNDIIFYRKIEEDLSSHGIDMLPAGNKDAVIKLYKLIKSGAKIKAPVFFIVDNDLWIHRQPDDQDVIQDIFTTTGYSIENDLYIDGDLEGLMDASERRNFENELHKFIQWYTLAVQRKLNGEDSTFRTHPNKILDDQTQYNTDMKLKDGESYPHDLFTQIKENYKVSLRGKSLFALLIRQLSATKRKVKFSAYQLMEIGASRRGVNYQRITNFLRISLEGNHC